jgi:hypothetical protein
LKNKKVPALRRQCTPGRVAVQVCGATAVLSHDLSTPPNSYIPVATCTTLLQKDCRSRFDFLSLATNTAYHQHLINRDSSAAVHNAADVLGRRDSLVMEAQYYCYYHCLLLQPTQTVRPVHKMQEHACMRERWG